MLQHVSKELATTFELRESYSQEKLLDFVKQNMERKIAVTQ